jgi:hypothetical protein
LPGEKAAAFLRISLHAQRLILTTQPAQLLTLITREAIRALALTTLGLPDPRGGMTFSPRQAKDRSG